MGGRIRVQGEALVGVHRIETVALFRFLFGVKKEGHHGKMPFARRPGTQMPPPLSFHNSLKNCGNLSPPPVFNK